MDEVTIINAELLRDADYISEPWKSGVQSIFETGRRLAEIKKKYITNRGAWSCLIGDNQWKGKGLLPFSAVWVRKLIAVSTDVRLRNHGYVSLPADTNTLYQLSRLSDERLEDMFGLGIISPSMKRSDASDATREERRAADEKRVSSLVPQEGTYRTLIIDPPWFYDTYSPATRGRPEYAEMTLDQIREMDVPGWAADDFCHLYLWATNNYVLEAGKLIEAWGFDYKTILTWVKPRWGLGAYFRHQTEQCLFAVRGKKTTRVDNISTIIEAPALEHSVKPQAFYDIAKKASFPPYGEVFQRAEREGIDNLYAPA